MRLYDYECPKCGFKAEYLTMAGDVWKCPECRIEMKRLPPVFRINMGPVPLTGYYDENLQTYIRTNEHRKQVMREQGVSEYGATPKPGAIA